VLSSAEPHQVGERLSSDSGRKKKITHARRVRRLSRTPHTSLLEVLFQHENVAASSGLLSRACNRELKLRNDRSFRCD